jgi:hypothetical protein
VERSAGTWHPAVEVKIAAGRGRGARQRPRGGPRLLDRVGAEATPGRDTVAAAPPRCATPPRAARRGSPGLHRVAAAYLHDTRCASWSPGPGTRSGSTGPAPRCRLQVRVLPALRRAGRRRAAEHGTFATPRAAAGDRRHGLRRRLPAADPPDRHGQPQGPEHPQFPGRQPDDGPTTSARRGRSAAPRAARRRPPAAGHDGGLPRLRRPHPRARHGGGAGLRAAGRARPPVGQAHPGVVHHQARRHDRLRGEPAEEVPGHLPDQLRQRPRGHLRRVPAGHPGVDRTPGCGSSASTTRTPSR